MGEEEIRAIVQERDAERSLRLGLEQRIAELEGENQRARSAAEEAARALAIRAELHKLGIAKVDLAFKAVNDEIVRGADGNLAARDGTEMKQWLGRFAAENPELLPARLTGG